MATSLIIGIDGMIGSALAQRLSESGSSVIGTSRRVESSSWILDLLAEPTDWELPDQIDVAYLCAAITSTDRCRQDPSGTRLINVERTLHLASRLQERGAHVVFPSTSQVYDGAQPQCLADESPCPRSQYGRQKAEVERVLLKQGNATIVRFTKIVRPRIEAVNNWAAALRQGKTITAFHDLVFSPIPLGFCIDALQQAGTRREGGIVQVSGERDVSYAELAGRLAERLQVPLELVQAVSRVTRGIPDESALRHTTLDVARLEKEWGLPVPAVEATLIEMVEGAIHD